MSAICQTWVIEQSVNSDGEIVFRLKGAKSRVPASAYVDGKAPDLLHPPPGVTKIGITWPNGARTEHYVSGDDNKGMITHRADAIRKNYAPFINKSGQRVAITALSTDGEFVVSIAEN